MSLGSLIKSYKLELLTCEPTDYLDQAIDIMIAREKNAVAVIERIAEGDTLVGILTDHDIIRAVHSQQRQSSSFNCERVFDWMTSKVITCAPETKLSKALDMMGKYNIRHLIVENGGDPLAIVSIRDILRKIHEQDELENNVLRDMARASRIGAAA